MSARHQFVEQYDWSKKFVELGHFDLGAYKCQTPDENNSGGEHSLLPTLPLEEDK